MGYKPKNIEPGTYPFPRKQVPVDGLKPFAQRLKEITPLANDLGTTSDVNIGFAAKPSTARIASDSTRKRRQANLESLARKRILKVPLEQIHQPDEDSEAPMRQMMAAKHYGIFEDLFGHPHYFLPVTTLPVFYPLGDQDPDSVQPVFHGNYISAVHARSEPLVDLSALPKEHLWTLIMTCPDEPLPNVDGHRAQEYVHWMVCNICPELVDGAPKSGDLIVEYSPPLPYQGTGFHRYVFVLYCQEKGPIDLSQERRGPLKSDPAKERSFSTAEFYRSHQDNLTPAGLAFFQSTWDPSVREYFREQLTDFSEPVFELEWPSPLPPPQSRFPEANSWHHPRRHPDGLPLANNRLGVHEDVSFDVYLDRYRDRKDLNAEVVRERLAAEGNPLNADEPTRQQPEFPLAVPIDPQMPSWWRVRERQKRLRQGRWQALEGHQD
ncbi:hypothetical protein AAHC03_01859 [Spirometra sp. Aus1]